MFKKWFIRCMLALLLVVTVISVTLAYQFTKLSPGGKKPAEVIAAPPEEPVDMNVALKPVTIVKGQPVDPYAFLSSATSSNVVAFFREEIDTGTGGKFEIMLTLNDGEKRADVPVTLYILEANTVTREAGAGIMDLVAKDFVESAEILPEGETVNAFLQPGWDAHVDYDAVGTYDVSVSINGVEAETSLFITDTIAPTATAVAVTVNLGFMPAPQDFVTNVYDLYLKSIYFANSENPDVFVPGERSVAVVVEDESGNFSEYNASLTVLPNTEPPAFTGVKDLEAFLGDPVMYRLGVTALDSFGNELDFNVDSKTVDINTPGDYPVTYTARDAGGLTATKTVNLKVLALSEDAIAGTVTELLAQIITEDMTTQRQKARAVFDWITRSIGYVSDSPKDSVYEGAYRALQYRQGDCFTFYAIAEVLLTRLEIPNERVTRVGGSSSHYWNLVNADGEGWYHFDSTHDSVHTIDRFMFTDTEAAEYTEIIREATGSRDYYTYDKTLHPEVVQ